MFEQITSPADVRALPESSLDELAAEIRSFLIENVSRTGGHLGPNLGVVELSIALHRVFNSPDDAIVWDTGHQSYVHKILTGRAAGFDQLRKSGGLSGYPSRAESPHDLVENSHASTSLSYADGLAKAWERRGVLGTRHVVAVIGDGALTGGMAWEALNNIAGSDRQVVIVVNDNARSYSPTIGGLAQHLATLRTTKGYENFLDWGKRTLQRTPVVGGAVYEALHGMKKGVKDIVAPQGMFEDLGLKYIGPVDGHNIAEVEHALSRAKVFPGPVIVHAITEKGHGYGPALDDEAERFHAVGVVDPDTGKAIAAPVRTWTSVFTDELIQLAHERSEIVAITAAMLGPTGLAPFAERYPDRVYDVGIAEQHAATSAAGLAMGGMHPVVAVYGTFLNRAYDQVLLDCAMHGLGVTFVLDRAGVTGDDGASHNGVWDLAVLASVPGLRMNAPRDETTLRAALAESVAISDAVTVVRYPKGALGQTIPAIESRSGYDIVWRDGANDVLIVAVGAFVSLAIEVAKGLGAQGIGVTVVDPRWVKPLGPELTEFATEFRQLVTVEDGVRAAGIGSSLLLALADAGIERPTRVFGIDEEFLAHGTRSEVLARAGLTAQQLARTITESVLGLRDVRDTTGQESVSDDAL